MKFQLFSEPFVPFCPEGDVLRSSLLWDISQYWYLKKKNILKIPYNFAEFYQSF